MGHFYLTRPFSGAAGFSALFALVLCAVPGTARGEAPEQAPTEETISGLVAALESDSFATRKDAESRLTAVGEPALEAVAETARTGSLEASTRALNVLLRWCSPDGDPALRLKSLEALARLPDHPAEAALAQDYLARVREEEATKELIKLGADIDADMNTRGGVRAREGLPLHVTIGTKKWTGEEADLALLPKLQRVMKVSLYHPGITDAVFEYLAAMPNLRRVEMFGTKATEQAANKFQRGRGVEVDFNPGGARLGIRDGLGEGGALVGEVAINSPAARAGLTPGDVIVSVDGKPVGDFTALKEHIKGYRPGDSAECSIRRDGKVITVEVQFDRWSNRPEFQERRVIRLHRVDPQQFQAPPVQIPEPIER